MGIISATKFSYKKNLLNEIDYKKILNHINKLKVPLVLNNYFKKKDINSIFKYMRSDKKNISSKINLILIKKIGKILINTKYNEFVIKKYLYSELENWYLNWVNVIF